MRWWHVAPHTRSSVQCANKGNRHNGCCLWGFSVYLSVSCMNEWALNRSPVFPQWNILLLLPGCRQLQRFEERAEKTGWQVLTAGTRARGYIRRRAWSQLRRRGQTRATVAVFLPVLTVSVWAEGKKRKKKKTSLPDNGVMKWPPWPALSCHSFVLMRRFHFTPRANKAQSQLFTRISWFQVQKGVPRIKRSPGSSCLGWWTSLSPVWDVHPSVHKYLDRGTALPSLEANLVLEGQRAHPDLTMTPDLTLRSSLKSTFAWKRRKKAVLDLIHLSRETGQRRLMKDSADCRSRGSRWVLVLPRANQGLLLLFFDQTSRNNNQ